MLSGYNASYQWLKTSSLSSKMPDVFCFCHPCVTFFRKQILNHLGKLLVARVPTGTPVNCDQFTKGTTTSAYQQLIQGVGTAEHGNVVGCLTALATAAGNEQLWKPLNFAVLKACGHSTRSEVRKAGISCLLSIIETIGEEYMILLPECLPVLSELLEDEDEIACMAKECVRQGEELLGESLEDSLR